MVCTRSTASTPEVGFCLGSSGRHLLEIHRAHRPDGTPLEANRVYLALTWLTYAGKLMMPPHLNSTSGGMGFLSLRVFSCGMQQLKSFSTFSTTLCSELIPASKNISTVSLQE